MALVPGHHRSLWFNWFYLIFLDIVYWKTGLVLLIIPGCHTQCWQNGTSRLVLAIISRYHAVYLQLVLFTIPGYCKISYDSSTPRLGLDIMEWNVIID